MANQFKTRCKEILQPVTFEIVMAQSPAKLDGLSGEAEVAKEEFLKLAEEFEGKDHRKSELCKFAAGVLEGRFQAVVQEQMEATEAHFEEVQQALLKALPGEQGAF
ncbi:hypothetical protein Pan97_21240 [Bremerella volcania]|uniref:Uncharacterized protein n=1 Tax=Bremerella volcania TaxID=2527984 RepID=A0A518C7D3_9BACT|nr:hypothetical protein [Bremerella volcania]QDU75102.1 hypothetical protein Pan97_21240 [Bremerella volcania]